MEGYDNVAVYQVYPSHVVHYITNVYKTLGKLVLSYMFSVWLSLCTKTEGYFISPLLIALWAMYKYHNVHNKLMYTMLISCCFGIISSNMISVVNQSTVLLLCLITATVFVTISVFIQIFPVPQLFLLGGYLATMFNVHILILIFNMFTDSYVSLHDMYVSLTFALVFLIHNTQIMCYRADIKKSCYVEDAFIIFFDLINIFARLIVISTYYLKNFFDV